MASLWKAAVPAAPRAHIEWFLPLTTGHQYDMSRRAWSWNGWDLPPWGPWVTAAFVGLVAAALGYAEVHFLVLIAVVALVGYACPRLLELWWRSRRTGEPRDNG
jgi:hypothetical protein